MKINKNILKKYLLIPISILILTLFLGTIDYLTEINSTTISIIVTISMSLLFIIIGFKEGKKADKQGYLAGLKIGAIYTLVLLIISLLLTGFTISLSKLIYYTILISSSTIGAMYGINKKDKN